MTLEGAPPGDRDQHGDLPKGTERGCQVGALGGSVGNAKRIEFWLYTMGENRIDEMIN
jgi:hypothetical protein